MPNFVPQLLETVHFAFDHSKFVSNHIGRKEELLWRMIEHIRTWVMADDGVSSRTSVANLQEMHQVLECWRA